MVRERIDILSTGGRSEIQAKRASLTDPTRAHGLIIGLSGLFTGTGARQQRGVSISGDRTASYVMGGDAHDFGISFDYNNYAVNTPAGAYARGLNVSLANRGSGTIEALQGAFIAVRQRGDAGAITNVRGTQIDVQTNVGAAVPSGLVEGLRVEMQLETNMPTQADSTGGYGVIVDQRTDGVYTPLPVAAYAVRNRGTSGCKGFSYGIDFYDSRKATCDLAEIRMMTADAGGLPAIWASGTATDDAGIVADIGADTLWADGSLYSSIFDGAGKLFIKINDVWTSAT